MYGYFFGMSLLWWIFWVVVLVGFFMLATPVPRRRVREVDPLQVLKRRYAAGEITTAEYDERRARILDRESHDGGHPRVTVPPPVSARPPEAGRGSGHQPH
jgi:putative membrane protein